MEYFKWTSEFELGIPTIDNQHKQIADYINTLHVAIERNDKKSIKKVAQNVVNYTYEHFAYEEGLLKKANYILTDPHIMMHNNFKNSVAKMRDDIFNAHSSMVAAKKMRSTLTVWLGTHIKQEDADYAKDVRLLFKKKSLLGNVFNFFSK